MQTQHIDKFIETYNDNIKSYNLEYNCNFNLILKKSNLVLIYYSNLLEYLFFFYTFNNSNLCSFLYFFDNILENNINKNWLAFAEYSDYGFYYVFNKETNEVSCVFKENNIEEFYCAKDLTSFFLLMTKYIKVEIFLRSEKKPQDQNYFRKIYEECLEIAGGKRYSEFLKYLIGI